MSVIDRAMRGMQQPAADPPAQLSVPDALATVLVAAVSVDGTLGVEESARMHGIILTSRLMRQAGGADAMDRAVALLNDRGAGRMLAQAAEALPPELRPTAFALAVDLVLADGRADAQEKTFVDTLQQALGLDDALAVRIVEVMLIKNRA